MQKVSGRGAICFREEQFHKLNVVLDYQSELKGVLADTALERILRIDKVVH